MSAAMGVIPNSGHDYVIMCLNITNMWVTGSLPVLCHKILCCWCVIKDLSCYRFLGFLNGPIFKKIIQVALF